MLFEKSREVVKVQVHERGLVCIGAAELSATGCQPAEPNVSERTSRKRNAKRCDEELGVRHESEGRLEVISCLRRACLR